MIYKFISLNQEKIQTPGHKNKKSDSIKYFQNLLASVQEGDFSTFETFDYKTCYKKYTSVTSSKKYPTLAPTLEKILTNLNGLLLKQANRKTAASHSEKANFIVNVLRFQNCVHCGNNDGKILLLQILKILNLTKLDNSKKDFLGCYILDSIVSSITQNNKHATMIEKLLTIILPQMNPKAIIYWLDKNVSGTQKVSNISRLMQHISIDSTSNSANTGIECISKMLDIPEIKTHCQSKHQHIMSHHLLSTIMVAESENIQNSCYVLLSKLFPEIPAANPGFRAMLSTVKSCKGTSVTLEQLNVMFHALTDNLQDGDTKKIITIALLSLTPIHSLHSSSLANIVDLLSEALKYPEFTKKLSSFTEIASIVISRIQEQETNLETNEQMNLLEPLYKLMDGILRLPGLDALIEVKISQLEKNLEKPQAPKISIQKSLKLLYELKKLLRTQANQNAT